MFSRRTISLFVLVALVFGTWTATNLVLSQEATPKDTEVSEKSGATRAEDPPDVEAQAEDRRFVETYPISGADTRTVVDVLRSVAANTEFGVDSVGNQLIAIGPKADHEKIRQTLEKLVSKKPVTAPSPAGIGKSSGQFYTLPGFPSPAPTNARPEDPQMQKLLEADAEMEEDAKELVVRYRFAAGEKEQGLARTKLEELTNEHFDVRQERRGLELSRLEQRLERVRASIEAREEARELIIRTRVSQLLGEGDDLTF